ncbi:hypothetical protein, partial [Escherichia coli]|uniref:hypothetical protein n=1 Tax=Escherichia coli TaxID=562 RepID=UPI0039C8AA38
VCQILSNVLNHEVFRGEIYEASGLGAAIVGFIGLRYYKDFSEAVKNMVRHSKKFQPQREYEDLYSQLYEKVYKKIYVNLKPLYKKMQEITGYPEF